MGGPGHRRACRLEFRPPIGASDMSGNSPFWSGLTAVRWVLMWVALISNRLGPGPLPDSSAKMRLNTPSRLPQTNRM